MTETAEQPEPRPLRLTIAKEITQQTQPTSCSCVSTCVAMAVGVPVADLGVDLERPHDFYQFGGWLAERGIFLRHWETAQRWYDGKLYLVGVRSLNKIASDHAVLVDTRGGRDRERGERSHWRTIDPNRGRDGVQLFDWVEEYLSLEAWSFEQEDLTKKPEPRAL